ncbi:hypothetical protein PUNSTDRAFT_112761 [Punctularia strigosozonata HHB-11173 SS5]|uniref:uncharacterized protein n=1 Tax=Punctularia strigosozonata (strain HHB-11173) TaxID=741275 RepID=UPI0004417DF0|nr:uncharacterized protein PUNSTDRAFT_112761 [Punctularia strigosozonata HHB-11173 SS5]EIN10968.1 hypothetical protein PUNSTDRAFT_112761 [Punctularia strigosozonata HHB-11173 SS5]
MPQPSQSVRVVVRLPYDRPEEAVQDPPTVEWNTEKENILWEVIARSRGPDSGVTDWKGLAAHLQVPLPYLLFRAQTRYEEDLRGLQGIRGALQPLGVQAAKQVEEFPAITERPNFLRKDSYKAGSPVKLTGSTRNNTPLSVRARLNSLNAQSQPRPKKATSSSAITVKGTIPRRANPTLRATSPSTSGSGSSDESESEAVKAEEAERAAEHDTTLERKLRDLERMMTNETLGLVQSSQFRTKDNPVDRGRTSLSSSAKLPHSDGFPRSESLSSTDSPRGSIPMIPSPPSESQRSSPVNIHPRISPGKPSSPPAVSPRSARSVRHHALIRASTSEQGSTHGSSASSFSDISG